MRSLVISFASWENSFRIFAMFESVSVEKSGYKVLIIFVREWIFMRPRTERITDGGTVCVCVGGGGNSHCNTWGSYIAKEALIRFHCHHDCCCCCCSPFIHSFIVNHHPSSIVFNSFVLCSAPRNDVLHCHLLHPIHCHSLLGSVWNSLPWTDGADCFTKPSSSDAATDHPRSSKVDYILQLWLIVMYSK